MAEKEYIEREAFLTQKREQYCKDCARRKGMRNGKYKTLYEIGEAPCRACEIDDVLNDVEDFPATDVRPVVHGKWEQKEVFEAKGYVDELQSAFCPVCQRYHTTPYSYYFTQYNFCPNCGARMEES